MLDAIAGRYARALADIVGAGDGAALAKMSAEIDLLAHVLGAEPELRTWFDDPTVPAGQKAEALKSLGSSARLSDLARRFIHVVVEHRRVIALPAIAATLDAIKDEAMAIVPAAPSRMATGATVSRWPSLVLPSIDQRGSIVAARRRSLAAIIGARSCAGRISQRPTFTPGCFEISWMA